jgi:hypothetical protein
LFQNRSDITYVIIYIETLFNSALKIDAPPASHAVSRGAGARFNECGEFGFSLCRQAGLTPPAVTTQKAGGARLIETVNPSAQSLSFYAIDTRRVRTFYTV